MDHLLASTLTWIYYTYIFLMLSPLQLLAVDAFGDPYPSYRSSAYSSRGSDCSFPEHWRGTWFQNGLGDFQIKKHYVSHIGRCFSHERHKYLLFKKKDMCFVCLAFTPQHNNILQYKQSYCVNSEKIDEVCSLITGDFILHTMVKVSGSPIQCPFQGHYSFSYTNGSMAQCDDPPSSIQACADTSKFLFNHRRCPRVANSHEKVESFKCLAVWDNGVDHYMYGQFTGPLLTSKESQYRCFMYSLYGAQGVMSMTADATCQGLQTPDLGMNVYKLQHKSDEWPQPRCRFPQFLTSNQQWRDVIGRRKYQISKREEVITVWDIEQPSFLDEGEAADQEARLRMSCIREIDSVEYGQQKKVDMMVYVTDDKCDSSYRCIRLTQRTEGVVNIQIGRPSEQTAFPSCQEALFTGTERHVLIPLPEDGVITPKPCPLPGLYSYVDSTTNCRGDLNVGCSRDNEMVVTARCEGKESADVLQCYDSWTENDGVYLIAGRLGDMPNSADCLVYKVTPKGYQLEADASCTHDRIDFMGRHIGFVLNAPHRSCNAVTTRPPEIVRPRTRKPTRQQQHNNNNNDNNKYNNNKSNNKNNNDDHRVIPDTYDMRDVRRPPSIDSADVLDTPGERTSNNDRGGGGSGCIKTGDRFLVILSLAILVFISCFWGR